MIKFGIMQLLKFIRCLMDLAGDDRRYECNANCAS